jgi:hypothetical protein
VFTDVFTDVVTDVVTDVFNDKPEQIAAAHEVQRIV